MQAKKMKPSACKRYKSKSPMKSKTNKAKKRDKAPIKYGSAFLYKGIELIDNLSFKCPQALRLC